jgi:hypothetical protein
MTPHLLIVYTSSLFARGLVHLLASRVDCAVVGTLPITEVTADRLADTSATVVILEGDDADPATGSAMRVLHGWGRVRPDPREPQHRPHVIAVTARYRRTR